MTAADWSVERIVGDHAVEVRLHGPGKEFTLTQDVARLWASYLVDSDDPFADEIRHAARDADLCRCGHRLAAWGDLCSVCSEANEPKPDVA